MFQNRSVETREIPYVNSIIEKTAIMMTKSGTSTPEVVALLTSSVYMDSGDNYHLLFEFGKHSTSKWPSMDHNKAGIVEMCNRFFARFIQSMRNQSITKLQKGQRNKLSGTASRDGANESPEIPATQVCQSGQAQNKSTENEPGEG